MERKSRIDEDLSSFIAESNEIVEEIEPHLIKLGEGLEKNELPDDETVNLIFRGFHTIKGTAAFYQLDSVVALAHKAETLLEFFRSGHETLNASCTDVLCQTLDVMGHLFTLIESGKGDDEAQDRIRSVIHRLNGRIDSLRKKSESQSCLTLDDEASDENSDAGPEQFFSSQSRVGKYMMIFVSESRAMIRQIMEMKFLSMPDDSASFRQDELDFCSTRLGIMADSSGFLGLDALADLINKALEWIGSKDKDTDVAHHDVGMFSGMCIQIMSFLDRIEQWGTDREGIHIDFSDSSEDGVKPCIPEPVGSFQDLNVVFMSETIENLNNLEKKLIWLREERLNRAVQGDVASLFHQMKGSSGLMGYVKLETLCGKAEAILEDVFDELIFLDMWDIKALWEVSRVVRLFVKNLEHGTLDFSAFDSTLHILDQISSGIPEEEKEQNFILPEMNRETAESNDKLTDKTVRMPADVDCMDTVQPDTHQPHDIQPSVNPAQIQEMSVEDSIPGGIERRKTDRRDIRVSIEKLDELINLVGELVIAENMVVKNPDVRGLELENFDRATAHLRKIVRDLQDVALAVRMIPVSGVFRKMIRLVHDQSSKTGKKVNLKIIGDDTEIDKTVAELISDPLVHLIRNAIDHGIQKKTSRNMNEPDGWIVLEARHEGGEVLVIVKDTGKGLDTEKILEKAMASGIVKREDLPLSDRDAYDLIFHPGFSTCDTVSDFSGRGVGLDVVRRNLDKIKGRIDVFSRKGRGCSFVMRIPLTLAIIDGMLVRVGESSYTIPLLSIRETLQIKEKQVTTTMDGQEMVRVRDEMIPVIRLHDVYGMGKDDTEIENGLIVVVEHQEDVAGLLIHDILGEQQAVIKGMSGYMDQVAGISGCTILGDGEVSLILDVGGLIRRSQSREGGAVLKNTAKVYDTLSPAP